jgi:hypothetical protein
MGLVRSTLPASTALLALLPAASCGLLIDLREPSFGREDAGSDPTAEQDDGLADAVEGEPVPEDAWPDDPPPEPDTEADGAEDAPAEEGPPEGWLGDWQKRVRLSVSGALLTEGLSDFPLMVHVGNPSGPDDVDTSFVFDELSSGEAALRLAVTGDDGLTQTQVEVERWDAETREGGLWARVPFLAPGVPTVLYLYYDADAPDNVAHVGIAGSDAAAGVWDAGFAGVWHLGESGSGTAGEYRDSTASGHDGTGGYDTYGAPQAVEGVVGIGQAFEGAQAIGVGIDAAALGIDGAAPKTVTAWAYAEVFDDGGLWQLGSFTEGSDFSLRTMTLVDQWRGQFWGSGVYDIDFTCPSANRWVSFAVVYDGAACAIYADGTQVAGRVQALTTGLDAVLTFGHWYLHPFTGRMDEVRISSTARSPGWIAFSHASETDALITWGIEESW